MNKLVLVRHGESMGNVWDGAYNDDRTNFLTLKGVKQAEIAGIDLARKGFEFHQVITSRLTRAMQTSTIICQTMEDWKREYIIDPRLNEGEHKYGDELLVDFEARVEAAFEEVIRPSLKHGNVLLVTHYFVMNKLFEILGIDKRMYLMHSRLVLNAVPYVWDQSEPSKLVVFDPTQTMTDYTSESND